MQREYIDGAVHLVRAPHGAGKSEYIENMIASGQWKREETIICSRDEFMVNADNEYEFKPWKITNADIQCRLKFIKALWFTSKPWKHIVVDNCNIEFEHMAEYILLTKSSNYFLFITELPCIHWDTGKPLSARELAINAAGHGVTEKQVAAQLAKYRPVDYRAVSKLCENDVLDDFETYQNIRVVTHGFDPDKKSRGISTRISSLMEVNYNKELAEAEFSRVKSSKSQKLQPFRDALKPYKTLLECSNAWKMIVKDDMEGNVTGDDEILMKVLGEIHDYFYNSSEFETTACNSVANKIANLKELEMAEV